jgi:mono/diheme cytochrome c family protein
MQRRTNIVMGLCAGATMMVLAACGSAATAVPPTVAPVATEAKTTEAVEVPKPSNAGGPGAAIGLTGDAKAGATIYVDQCKKCHGDEGKGGVNNPGSTDETIPPLNPIDEGMVNKDAKVFAQNIDLFIEHGSTPEGKSPKENMSAFGDEKKLTPQQIADVIAYVISLNKQ